MAVLTMQKAKLRVGKDKAKPANFTDTSFSMKTISMPGQSLNNRLEGEVDIIKRLNLTKHHQSSTRKETLIYIENHLPDNPSLYKQILSAIMPLIIDQSSSVRTALVSLLVACAQRQPSLMELHARSMVLFIHSAMTHINTAIRNDSSKFLDVLVQYGPDSLLRSSWVRTLRSFFTLLAWTLNDSKQSVSLAVTTSSVTNTSSKAKKVLLESFHKFVKAGCNPSEAEANSAIVLTEHYLTSRYLIPTTPQPFAHLQLFAREISQKKESSDTTQDLNAISCEDSETRRRVFVEFFAPQVLKNVGTMIKDGGEVGKTAKSVQVLVEELIVAHAAEE